MNRELKKSLIYAVVGTTEEIKQAYTNGEFICSYAKSIAALFKKKQEAQKFIKSSKAKEYYKLEIEKHILR